MSVIQCKQYVSLSVACCVAVCSKPSTRGESMKRPTRRSDVSKAGWNMFNVVRMYFAARQSWNYVSTHVLKPFCQIILHSHGHHTESWAVALLLAKSRPRHVHRKCRFLLFSPYFQNVFFDFDLPIGPALSTQEVAADIDNARHMVSELFDQATQVSKSHRWMIFACCVEP